MESREGSFGVIMMCGLPLNTDLSAFFWSVSHLKPTQTHWQTPSFWRQTEVIIVVAVSLLLIMLHLESQFCHFSREIWCNNKSEHETRWGRREIQKKRGLIHVQWPGKCYRLTQSLKNHEDWWHKDNSAPADLFGRQAPAYCCPSHLCPCSHSQLHHVGLKWKHESYPEFTSVKEEKKMTLPFHPSQGWGGG